MTNQQITELQQESGKMTNQQITELQQETGFIVRDIRHIATQWEAESLFTLLEEINGNELWENTFPDTDTHGFTDGDDLATILIDANKLGFILEIGLPEKSYRFNDEGEARSASVNEGIQELAYAYGDTIEQAYQKWSILKTKGVIKRIPKRYQQQ